MSKQPLKKRSIDFNEKQGHHIISIFVNKKDRVLVD